MRLFEYQAKSIFKAKGIPVPDSYLARSSEEIKRKEGMRVGLLKLNTVWPVPEKQIKEAAEKARIILAVEMNIGKYAGEIERIAGCNCEVKRVTKNVGEIHTSGEILEAIHEVTK